MAQVRPINFFHRAMNLRQAVDRRPARRVRGCGVRTRACVVEKASGWNNSLVLASSANLYRKRLRRGEVGIETSRSWARCAEAKWRRCAATSCHCSGCEGQDEEHGQVERPATTPDGQLEQPDQRNLREHGFNYRETPAIVASQLERHESTLRLFPIKLKSGVECNAIGLSSAAWFSQDDRRKGWTGMEKDCNP